MKNLRKVLVLVLALMVVFAFSAMAFADGDPPTTPKGSITVTNPVTDPNAEKTTYEAYRIFDMTTNGATDDKGNYTAVAYTINSDWEEFFIGENAPGAAYLVDENNEEGTLNGITVYGQTKYINITDDNVAEFAKKAFEYAQNKSVTATISVTVDKGENKVKFEDLDLGYYMVYPKGASVQKEPYTSIVSITNTAPNGTVEQKAVYPTLTKTADDVSTEVGQKVTYTLNSNVPDTTGYTAYEFTFKDKTSYGLTFDGVNSITVKIGDKVLKDTEYTVDQTEADFALTINLLKEDKTAKYAYNAPIVVTYTATVNENAVSKIDNNNATLTYNNDPKNAESKDTTPTVEVKTYSSKLVINKVDGSNTKIKLKDAKFVLRVKSLGNVDGDSHEIDIAAGKYYYYDTKTKDVKWITVESEKPEDLAKDNTITVVVTDDNGVAAFSGLENGVYELIEVEAPSGYNLLTTPTEVTISGSDSDEAKLTVTSEVKNNSGSTLPTTGGMGTTIFYVLGAALVVGCGVVLVSKKRMNNK